MGFSSQEYCSGLPFPSPGDLSHPGIEPRSPTPQADSLPSEPAGQKILRKGGKNTQKNYTKKDLHDPDNNDGVNTHLEPDILECKVQWALGRITVNKASGDDGITAELFQTIYC